MDHLFLVHGIAKDTNHHGSTILSKEAKVTREQCKKHALDAGMSEARFQGICTTRYIIRKLLPFSHHSVECPEFRATVHSVWKIIKTSKIWLKEHGLRAPSRLKTARGARERKIWKIKDVVSLFRHKKVIGNRYID
jgi:hypothetical protein